MKAPITEDTLINVRRQWNDYRVGAVQLRDLRGFHWRQTSGGVAARSPRPFPHARLWCDKIVDGEIAHSCRHGPPPHEVLVCIVKKDNPETFRELERLLESGH
jgi:hypothetical protein